MTCFPNFGENYILQWTILKVGKGTVAYYYKSFVARKNQDGRYSIKVSAYVPIYFFVRFNEGFIKWHSSLIFTKLYIARIFFYALHVIIIHNKKKKYKNSRHLYHLLYCLYISYFFYINVILVAGTHVNKATRQDEKKSILNSLLYKH